MGEKIECPNCHIMTNADDGYCSACGHALIFEEMDIGSEDDEEDEESEYPEFVKNLLDTAEKTWDGVKGEIAQGIGEAVTGLLGVEPTKVVCANCKNIINKDDRFCRVCGIKFSDKSPIPMKKCSKCGVYYEGEICTCRFNR